MPTDCRHALIPLVAAAASVAAQAFTDTNADLKEAVAERLPRVVVVGKAAPPARTAWVPVSPKRLDGFTPELPVLHGAAQALASADLAAAARR